MKVAERLTELDQAMAAWRRGGERIGLVPTMGNLHSGHLALLAALQPKVDRTVVSIFVNPTQFGPREDFDSYPRTLKADLDRLADAGCDLAWVPTVDQIYPLPESFMVRPPESLSGILCGQFRPGHFEGVASVVLRLFNQIRPDQAIFGQKDYQQLLVLRLMARDLSLPLEIVSLPTVREADGLAMSSRNQYLTDTERKAAPLLYQTLVDLADRLDHGDDWAALQPEALKTLTECGFRPQYLEWRCADTLGAPQPDRPQRLLAAAWLGKTRLIDNVGLTPSPMRAPDRQ